MPVNEASLTLEDFIGGSFDPDSFALGLLQDHMVEKGSGGNKEEFDPAAMLAILRSRSTEVEKLKTQAGSQVKEARELARRLGKEHRESVRRLKVEAEDALQEVSNLESKVASVGRKAVNIGQRIDKLDKQRRRAQEAEQAIHIYDALRSPDDVVRGNAMASLIPASATAKEEKASGWDEDTPGSPESGRSMSFTRSRSTTNFKRSPIKGGTASEATFMEAAGMLRKMDGMARVLRVEGSQRAVDGLAVVNERFEMALLSEFDAARARWSEEQSPEALEEMRRYAASLFSFNGGGSCIQRYVSTLKFCIDEEVILQDEEGIANANSVSSVADLIDRVVNEILQLVEEENETTKQVFPNADKVMSALLQRVFHQRLQRVVDACLTNLNRLYGVEPWMEAFEHAYGRVHSMVASLITQGRDVGDLDLDKLLQDVVGAHRDRFIEESFTMLTNSLASILPAPAPKPPSATKAKKDTSLPAAPSPRSRMIALEYACESTDRIIRGLLVASRAVPPGPLDGAANVLHAFQIFTDAVNAHLYAHLMATGAACTVRLDEKTVGTVPSDVKIAVHAVMMVQRFADKSIMSVTRADVKTTAKCMGLIGDFCVWIEKCVSEVLSLLIGAVSKTVSFRLSSIQQKTDFMPKGDECALEPTEACIQACSLLRAVSDAWIEQGPPSLHRGDKDKKSLAAGMDGNTRALFSELASAACDCVIEHIRRFQYSAVGGLQLMRDLGAWKALVSTMHAPDVERRFEDCRESANILVKESANLANMLEEGSFAKGSTLSVLDLLELRSDWNTIKGKFQQYHRATEGPAQKDIPNSRGATK